MPDEATQRWLAPMIAEAERQGIGNKVGVMMQKALFSAAEPDGHAVTRATPSDPDVDEAFSIDFIRLGELLRDELGWTDYPPLPPGYTH